MRLPVGNTKRLLSISLVLLIPACADLLVRPTAGDRNLEDFEVAWRVVDSVYPYLAFKGIDWDSIYVVYRARSEQARGDEFYQVLSDLLGELRDGHVYFQPDGGLHEVYPHLPPRQRRDRHAYSPFVVRRYFDTELQLSPNGKIEYGILPDSIGYAVLGDFHSDHLSSDLPAVLTHLRGTRGLILDIRHRKGGGYDQVEATVARFLTAPLEKPEFYMLGTRLDLPPFTPRGPFAYTSPVVVLINGSTFSAGELFTEVMKRLPNVTAVGDTTGGGSAGSDDQHAPGLHRLPSGKRIYIGTIDLRRYDGLPWEWLGVAPDIRVEQTEADITAGRDLQLEAAIALLR
jgi:hypothetical protein